MAANGQNNSGQRKLRRWLFLGIIAVAVVVLAAFVSLGRRDVVVRAEHAIRSNIVSLISTNGKVEPIENFEAHAPASTTVRRIYVHEGDHVRAGQLLLELDAADARAQAAKARAQLTAADADLHAVRSGGTREEVLTTQSQLQKAQAEVATAQRNLQALQLLQQKGAASAGEVQAAAGRLTSAQADLKLAEGRKTERYSTQDLARVEAQKSQAQAALAAANDLLTQSEVRAPRAGTVYSLPVRVGQYVNTGDLLAQVADLTTVQVRAFVDEPDIGRLRPDEQVGVSWDALPGRKWQGTLTRVPTTVVMVGARNVGEVTCRIANQDGKLLPNVNVTVNIITAQVNQALIVSREAVHQEGEQRYVYQVVDGQLRRRNVQTGVANLTHIQITGGLGDNALVALSSANGRPLQPGMSVRTD